MSVIEEIDRFTYWLSVCEAASVERGVGHMHGEWALGVWDKRALSLVVPYE